MTVQSFRTGSDCAAQQFAPHSARASRGKTTSYEKGLCAENVAAKTLEKKGFRVLDRRYRTPAGELDLVITGQEGLAFVEVKRRSSSARAGEAITLRQQARIADAAEIWLQAHPEYSDQDITFDAVLISPRQPPRHIRDAFRPAA